MSDNLSLNELSENVELDVPLSSISDRIALKRLELSGFVAAEILLLFKTSVGATMGIAGVLVLIDTISLWAHVIAPSDRLVNEHVLVALIGASVVQVGAASAAIVSGLFGKNQTSADAD